MRVLLVSDIHSNIEALDAVFEASPPDTFDAIWCAGDITGYGPNPTECVMPFMHRAEAQIVMGNHDAVISGCAKPIGFNPHALS
ncbi:MAG TPA: metallophosphoesterase family protein, partial [Candidatus Ozemobacteraceae bacterium]|nr:metallophosphoesterase family protein [Candidatus Ozemobacteraceae bacterium]